MIYGPWVSVWKKRMARFVDVYNEQHKDDPIVVPAGFDPKTWIWGVYAQRLARIVKKRAGIHEPDGRLDGDLRRILKDVRLEAPILPPFVGIDVSNHNGTIDWRKVAADPQRVRFAWIKATEGQTFVDRYYKQNLEGARRFGIAAGAYVFMRSQTVESALREVEKFLAEADWQRGDLRPALDWETNELAQPDDYPALLAAARLVRKKTGDWPVIYGGAYILRGNQIPADSPLRNCPLWLPAYGSNDGRRHESAIPFVPKPWDRVDVHQYTSNGSVQGIGTRVDMNHSYVTLAYLKGRKS